MSASYRPVSWNRFKVLYDLAVIAVVVAFYWVFTHTAAALPAARALDEQTRDMRAWGLATFLLLTLALAIGPAARLEPRLLPLLYNRRHLGVITATLALTHAAAALGWYFAYSDTPPLLAVLTADTSYGHLRGFSFVSFGIAGLLILAILAATSHDFWLAFLTPPVWKWVHFSIYLAYLCVIAHIGLGAMQTNGASVPVIVGASIAALLALHLAASRRTDPAIPGRGFVEIPAPETIAEGQARVFRLDDGRAVAVFRNGGMLQAVANACAHQNGPLGEGRVLDGCITCPWHGFQYRLADGCAPAPFTERIATYRLIRRHNRVWLDPMANPLGIMQIPLRIAEQPGDE